MDNFMPSIMSLYRFILIFTFAFASCENESKIELTQKSIAQQLNESKFKNLNQQNDAQFLVKSSEMNISEIQLGQLAQKNAYHADVKELGKMMVHAHSKLMTEVIELAKSKSISIPSSLASDNQSNYERLSKKNGISFDKAYCELMIRNHRSDIAIFEEIANSNQSDSDINTWANTSLQQLRKHLEYAEICNEKL